MVVIEFALALTLLSAAGLAIHSFWSLTQVDLGVRAVHMLIFFLPVSEGRFSQPEQMVEFYRRLLEKVESIPGVSRAEATREFEKAFSIVGQPLVDPSARPGAGFQMITPGYFQTLGISVVKARSFTEQDTARALPVAMVNETFVPRYLPSLDPLPHPISDNAV